MGRGMQRRHFVLGSPAVLATTACASPSDDIIPTPVPAPAKKTVAPPPAPAPATPPDPTHHDHTHHADPNAHANHAAMDAASDCLQMGQICVQHCLILLGQGDTTMAPCARAATDMLAVTQSVLALAAGSSELLKAQAQVAVTAAERCEAECRKHADKHPTCKDCADSCAKALTAYRALG